MFLELSKKVGHVEAINNWELLVGMPEKTKPTRRNDTRLKKRKVCYNDDDYIDIDDATGIIVFPDGVIYDGEYMDGKPNGKGKLSYPDGATYTGTFKAGTMISGDITYDPKRDFT